LRCERVLASAGNVVMMLRAVGRGGWAIGCSGWVGLARGEPRGGGSCRQLHRSSWCSMAGTESRKDDAADVAGPQLYAAGIGSSWRCERVLASAGCARMLCVAGGVVALGAVAGGWGLRGASRGAAARADSDIEAAGAASLAPSLGRMAQLTSLDLGGTLRAIGWACAVSGCLRAPAMS
jgi:hypothetical protein